MQKFTLIAISCLLLLSQIPHVFASSSENVSHEIERIEIGENCKTIYYKDGSKEVFVTCKVNVNFAASAGVAHVQTSPTPPAQPFPIDKIFRIIKQILDTLRSCGAGSALLALMIWNIIRR